MQNKNFKKLKNIYIYICHTSPVHTQTLNFQLMSLDFHSLDGRNNNYMPKEERKKERENGASKRASFGGSFMPAS
jgi:hypothetical protein